MVSLLVRGAECCHQAHVTLVLHSLQGKWLWAVERGGLGLGAAAQNINIII